MDEDLSRSDDEIMQGPDPTKLRQGNWLALVLIILCAAFFFREALLGRRTLVWDAADYFYPLFLAVSEALRDWHLPLWTPYLFNGFPLIGNIEAQTFYPPNLLFLPFTPFTPYAVYLSIILHCIIAGVSMYFLAKRLTGSSRSGLLSAIAFMFSGFMIGHVQHVTMIEVMAWFPLVYLLLDRSLVERRLDLSLAAGLVLGVSILAGHPQTSHAMMFVLSVHALFRGWSACRRDKSRHQLIFAAACLATCLATGALLAAVQLLPTMELTKEAVRGAPVTFQVAARSGQFSWYDLVTLFVPNYFGAVTQPYWGSLDISQSILYLGTVPLLFAGYGVASGRKVGEVLFFSIVAVCSLLFSLGEHGPLFRFFYAFVPGFNYFRSPAHTVFVSSFFISLLAGYGFRDLKNPLKKNAMFVVVAMLAIVPLAAFFFGRSPAGMLADAQRHNMVYGVAGYSALLLATAVIMLLCSRFPRIGPYCSLLLLAVAFGDSYLHFSSSVTSGIGAPPSYVERVPNRISMVRESAGIKTSNLPGSRLGASELSNGMFRIYTRPEGVIGTAPLGFNRAMIHRTFLVEGFEPLELSRHRTLVSTLSASNLGNLLRIMNVKYVSTLGEQGDSFEMFPPEAYLPRAFVVTDGRYLAQDGQALEALATFDPGREVIISGIGKDVSNNLPAAGSGSAAIEKYEGSRVEIRTSSLTDGFLVLSDTFYPGWTASLDGVATPVLRANYNFRAITLPRGDHRVVFEFSPRWLLAGGLISLCTLAVGLLVLVRGTLKGRVGEKAAKGCGI